jgi:tetratricopeptide (TPR) repeat protein
LYINKTRNRFYCNIQKLKRITLLKVLFFISFSMLWGGSLLFNKLCAQKIKPAAPTASLHWRVYQLARQNNDMLAARVALYYALAEDSANLALKDSLAVNYFSSGAYEQSLALGLALLKNRPNDVRLLSMVAFAYGALGATREALELYEKVYALSRLPYHLYQVAILQFNMRRFGECAQSVEKLLQSPNLEAEKVAVPKKGGKEYQDVNLKAAAFFVQGQLWKEQKDFAKAQANFEYALTLEPSFELAALMLQELKQAEKK